MQRAWYEIIRLIDNNAKHRKGFRLGEVDIQFVLENLAGEVEELFLAEKSEEIAKCLGGLLVTEDCLSEAADIVGVIFHYCIKKGYTLEQLENQVLEKLKLRFE